MRSGTFISKEKETSFTDQSSDAYWGSSGSLCLPGSRVLILPLVLGRAEWRFQDFVGRTGIQGQDSCTTIVMFSRQRPDAPRTSKPRPSEAAGSKLKPWVVGPEALGSGEDKEDGPFYCHLLCN